MSFTQFSICVFVFILFICKSLLFIEDNKILIRHIVISGLKWNVIVILAFDVHMNDII